MHDFDYDVAQRKRIARGAFSRKNGCRSKRCTLPSDYLSPAELRRRNGPMQEYKLNAPMSWDAFNAMPSDLQTQYITHLREKYRATDAMLGDMFGVHRATVFNFRKAANIGFANKMTRLDNSASQERDARWAEFTGVQPESVTLDPPEEPSTTREIVVDMAAELAKHSSANELRMSDLAATFSGEFNSVKFMLWLSKLPMPEGNVKIRIEVTAE